MTWKVNIAVLLLFLLLVASPAVAQEKVTVLLDDVPLEFDTQPTVIRGRTMVPFRFIAEALGVSVQWEGKTKTVFAQGYGKEVVLQVGSEQAFINKTTIFLDASPQVITGRTLVPLRFFSEAFGALVNWDPNTKTVSIYSPPRDMYVLGFYAIRSFEQRHLTLKFDACAFGWSRLTKEGRIALDGKDYYWPLPAGEITPERILEEAKQQGKMRYLMVFATDKQGELTQFLADHEAMQTAINDLRALVTSKGFDGVLFDLEGLGLNEQGDELRTTRERLTGFLTMAAENLRPAGIRLAAAFHAPNSAYKGYDYKSAARVLDEIVIMAYDYTYERAPEPIDKVHQAIRSALAEVPKEKIVLGISAWNETPESLRAKVGLAKRYGLKGISLWRLGLITDQFLQSLGEQIILD